MNARAIKDSSSISFEYFPMENSQISLKRVQKSGTVWKIHSFSRELKHFLSLENSPASESPPERKKIMQMAWTLREMLMMIWKQLWSGIVVASLNYLAIQIYELQPSRHRSRKNYFLLFHPCDADGSWWCNFKAKEKLNIMHVQSFLCKSHLSAKFSSRADVRFIYFYFFHAWCLRAA